MLRETTWRLDTCGCEVVYAWDDTLDSSLRTHTIVRVAQCCPHHQALSLSDHQTALFDENTRKNRLIARAATFLGVTSAVLLQNVNWTITPAPNRVLTITFTETIATALQKTQMQTWADTNIGVGRVVVG